MTRTDAAQAPACSRGEAVAWAAAARWRAQEDAILAARSGLGGERGWPIGRDGALSRRGRHQRGGDVGSGTQGVLPTRPAGPSQEASVDHDAERQQRRWAHGLVAFQRGQYTEACRAFGGCSRPEASAAVAEARFRLALAAARPAQALAELTAAIQCAPDDARLHAHRARLLWRTGDLAGARVAAGQATALAPEDVRYRELRELLDALAGQVPEGAGWRLTLLAGSADGAGALPVPGPDAPVWVGALAATMRAVARADWANVQTEAQRALGLSAVPPAALDLFRWYAVVASGALGRWADVLIAAPPVDAPLAVRFAALRRFAAAELLVAAAAGDGEPSAAERALEVLEAQGGASPDVRDGLSVAIGLLYAAREDWRGAIRRWTLAQRRFVLAQPLALAHELAGSGEAIALWERIASRRRAGGSAGGDGVAHQAVAIYDHLVGLAGRRGQMVTAAEYASRALVLVAAPDAERLRKVAGLWLAAHRRPSPKWDEIAAWMERALELDPGDTASWVQLAVVHRGRRRPQAALAAWRRAYALEPRRPELALELVEGFGWAVLAALEDADLEEAASLVSAMGQVRWEPESQALSWVEVTAGLTGALLARLRGSKRPPSPARWDAAFRSSVSVGDAASPAAYCLRGMLALLAAKPRRAQQLFDEVWGASWWERDAPGLDAALGWYIRWTGYAFCWSRQVRAGGVPEGVCAEAVECQAMQAQWDEAQMIDADSDPGQRPPPCIQGCPQVRRLYTSWRRVSRA